jgi:hypothetical protein
MKLITNQYQAVKVSYTKNIFLGMIHSVFLVAITLLFSPELLLLFAPKAIFTKVQGLKISKLNKSVILFASYIVLGIMIYFLFVFIKSNIFPYILDLFHNSQTLR